MQLGVITCCRIKSASCGKIKPMFILSVFDVEYHLFVIDCVSYH